MGDCRAYAAGVSGRAGQEAMAACFDEVSTFVVVVSVSSVQDDRCRVAMSNGRSRVAKRG